MTERRRPPKRMAPAAADGPLTAPPSDAPADDGGPIDAGRLSTWIPAIARALDGTAPADVPCGTCNACCTSSQFVHIGPDETETLARIPRALLFKAPGLPKGHVVMGYDEKGHCPMFQEGRCAIYAHRPRTCRTYDCRVLTATGLARSVEHEAIRARAARFVFDHESDDDRALDDALTRTRGALAKAGVTLETARATRLAVLVTEMHDLAVARDPASGRLVARPVDDDALRTRLDAREGRRGRPGGTR